MRQNKYDRQESVIYAKTWAYSRNPKYYNFDKIGGDCTNFISQCLYAGSKIMNYKKQVGWYYNSLKDRTASWSGVEFLYKFLINNRGVGPYGKEANKQDIEIGDVIQLSFDERKFTHSLIVVDVEQDNIYIASHTYDSYRRDILTYNFKKIRFIHIMVNFYKF